MAGHRLCHRSDFCACTPEKGDGSRSENGCAFASWPRLLGTLDESTFLKALQQDVHGLTRYERVPSEVGTRAGGRVIQRLQTCVLRHAQFEVAQSLGHSQMQDRLGFLDEESQCLGSRMIARWCHVNILTHRKMSVSILTSTEAHRRQELDMTGSTNRINPTLSGPDFVSFQVRDLETSATFYEDALGLNRLPATNPAAVVFSSGGTAFAVREPFPGVDLDAIGQLGAGIGVWFGSKDPSGLHARLVARDVPIVQEPFEGPFGLQFSLRDPDGYVVTIHTAG